MKKVGKEKIKKDKKGKRNERKLVKARLKGRGNGGRKEDNPERKKQRKKIAIKMC